MLFFQEENHPGTPPPIPHQLTKVNVTSQEAQLLSDWVHNNFLRINIHFKDITVTKTIQVPSYTLVDLWSNIGGILGLWIGMSIISGTERLVVFSRLPGSAEKREGSI